MILKDEIAPYVTKIKVPHSGYYAAPMRDGLTDEAQEIILTKVVKFFEPFGWKVKRLKSGNFVARKPKHHTKINFSIHYPYSKVELLAKTPNGGWGSIASSFYGSSSLNNFVQQAANIPAPIMITKDSLPEPWKFEAEAVVKNDNSRAWVYFNNEIQQCRVEGVVALKKDGSITKAVADVAKPNEQVWFHIDCANALGATFDIITDGEVFYPIKRYGKQRITDKTNPKASVDLKLMTEMDKQLVNLAIEQYFETQ
jgi:hypothetical protein